MASPSMNEPGDLDAEIRATRGTVLGESVWRFMATAGGLDPKDPALEPQRRKLVDAVQAASMVMDESGFEGLVDWLEMEEDAR